MMNVFREIEMSYDGETFVVEPNNKLMRRIDSEIDVSGAFIALGAGKPRMHDCAYMIAELLKAGGADATAEGVYLDIVADLNDNKGQGFAAIMNQIAEAISPPHTSRFGGGSGKKTKPPKGGA